MGRLETEIVIAGRNETKKMFSEIVRDSQSAQQAAGALGGSMHDAGENAGELSDGLGDASSSAGAFARGLSAARQEAEDTAGALGDAAAAAENAGSKLEKARNFGAGLAVAGAGALLLANNLIQVAESGAAVDARLQSIFKAQQRLNDLPGVNKAIEDTAVTGHFDSATVTESQNSAALLATMGVESEHLIQTLPRIAAIARSIGEGQEEIADTIGEAYRQIDLGGLEEAKLYFSEQQIEAVEAAKAISEVAGRAKFMELMLAEADSKAGALGDSLSEAAAAANDVDRQANKLQTSIGKGAAAAKQSVDGLTGSLLEAAGANEDVAKSAGGLLYLGGVAASGVGGLIALVSQIGLAVIAFPGLGVAGASAFGVITAAAGTAALAVGAILIPLALVVTAAVAAYKAVQWTQEATTKSDAEMEGPNSSFRQRTVAEAGRGLGSILSRGVDETGNAAEQQSAALFKKLRAKSSGEDPEDLKRSALLSAAAVNGTATPSATTPTISNVMAANGDDGASLDSAADAGTSKGARTKSSATNALQKAAKAMQRQREKEAKERARGLVKLQNSNIKAADETAKAQSEIAIEQINADFDIRSAQIKASVEGADDKAKARADYQIAQLEAAKAQRVTALRADGMKGVDKLGRDAALKIGGIELARKLTLADIALENALAKKDAPEDNDDSAARAGFAAKLAAGRLKGSYSGSGGGGAMFGMRSGDYGSDAPAFVGSDPRAMAAGIQAARSSYGNYGRGDGYENRNSSRGGSDLMAKVQSVVRDALGNIVVQFAPVTIADNDSMASAARLLSN